MATLEDLQKQVERMGGLYPFDLYSTAQGNDALSQAVARATRGGVNIPEVNLQGAPTLTPGQVLNVGQITGGSLPTPDLRSTSGGTGAMGNRLDQLMGTVGGEGESSVAEAVSGVLAGLDPSQINLGNIDELSSILASQLFPETPATSGSPVKNLIMDLIAAGQNPEFQQAYFESKSRVIDAKKAKNLKIQETRNQSQKEIYMKLLDNYLEDGKAGDGPKLQPLFIIDRESGKENNGVKQKIRDENGVEQELIYALSKNSEGKLKSKDDMLANEIFYQGNVYRPIDPEREAYDDDREKLRNAFDLSQASKSTSSFDAQEKLYTEKRNALGTLYQLADNGFSILGQIAPEATDRFGVAQKARGFLVSLDQQIGQMGELLLGSDQVASAAKEAGISVDKLKEQNNARTEKVRAVFRDPSRLNGVVDENGKEFNWARFGKLSDDEALNAQYQSILLQMAYQAAMVNGQEGRSLSDKDIANMLNIVGGQVSDVNGALRLMASFVLSTSSTLERKAKSYRQNFSQDLDRRPWSQERVDTAFIDPYQSLVKDLPNTLRDVFNVINVAHPDLFPSYFKDSDFDYNGFLDPATVNDGTTPPPPVDPNQAVVSLEQFLQSMKK